MASFGNTEELIRAHDFTGFCQIFPLEFERYRGLYLGYTHRWCVNYRFLQGLCWLINQEYLSTDHVLSRIISLDDPGYLYGLTKLGFDLCQAVSNLGMGLSRIQSYAMFTALFDLGISPTTILFSGVTFFHIVLASTLPDEEKVRLIDFLAKSGTNITSHYYADTALSEAIYSNSAVVVSALIRNGASMTHSYEESHERLYRHLWEKKEGEEYWRGKKEEETRRIQENPNVRRCKIYQPRMSAEIFALLLTAQLDINFCPGKFHSLTLYEVAVERGFSDLVHLMNEWRMRHSMLEPKDKVLDNKILNDETPDDRPPVFEVEA